MLVRILKHRHHVSLRGLVRRGLLLAVLLSVCYSLYQLRGPIPHQDDRLITLGRGAARHAQDGHSSSDRRPAIDSLSRRDSLLAAWPAAKPKAAILVLARNLDLEGVLASMAQMDQRFNAKAQYPYVFLNDQEFTQEFMQSTSVATGVPCLYGQVPREHWNYPEWIDQDKAAAVRKEMEERGVVYGGSESYRFMCRYFSGFFFRHPLLDGFEFYWRMEPKVRYFCSLPQDPFAYMQAHNISYGWNIMVNEVMATIPTLWPTVQRFMQEHPGAVVANNALPGMVVGDQDYSQYTGCHFWSNFEIGRLSFFRSDTYLKFFEHLDQAGGFFYERWGDAPVHSLAAALFLPKTQIHRFNEIGYQHDSWIHCPQEDEYRSVCECDTAADVNIEQPSCLEAFRAEVGIY